MELAEMTEQVSASSDTISLATSDIAQEAQTLSELSGDVNGNNREACIPKYFFRDSEQELIIFQ